MLKKILAIPSIEKKCKFDQSVLFLKKHNMLKTNFATFRTFWQILAMLANVTKFLQFSNILQFQRFAPINNF